ncbi:MAG: SpoIIIAH-like family protein [Clostridiales bacterium]|nr:SpoIIIAH-like family protein [Clostridiales bacterium]
MSKKKKIIVLASMVALLVLTGCLNYFLNRTDGAQNVNAGDSSTYTDYFTSQHADRSSSRSETVMYYNAIINSEATSATAKADAEKELAALVGNMETEQRLEALIKSLGYDDCLVTVGSENINVILKSGTMTEQEVGQVVEIIESETGKDAPFIRIKPINA